MSYLESIKAAFTAKIESVVRFFAHLTRDRHLETQNLSDLATSHLGVLLKYLEILRLH